MRRILAVVVLVILLGSLGTHASAAPFPPEYGEGWLPVPGMVAVCWEKPRMDYICPDYEFSDEERQSGIVVLETNGFHIVTDSVKWQTWTPKMYYFTGSVWEPLNSGHSVKFDLLVAIHVSGSLQGDGACQGGARIRQLEQDIHDYSSGACDDYFEAGFASAASLRPLPYGVRAFGAGFSGVWCCGFSGVQTTVEVWFVIEQEVLPVSAPTPTVAPISSAPITPVVLAPPVVTSTTPVVVWSPPVYEGGRCFTLIPFSKIAEKVPDIVVQFPEDVILCLEAYDFPAINLFGVDVMPWLQGIVGLFFVVIVYRVIVS